MMGSIPFGVLLTKYGAGFDLRAVGSHNIGATNVLRSGHKGLATLTLLLDGLKGIAVPLFNKICPLSLCDFLPPFETDLFICAAAIFGHLYPLFLKFKGGKGVATTAFCVWFLSPLTGLSLTVVWLVIFLKTKTSALAALAATLLLPLISYFCHSIELAVWSLSVGVFIIFKHRENIIRLRHGLEKKL